MYTKQRTGALIAAATLVPAFWAAPAAAQNARKSGATQGTAAMTVATVNGEKITRGEIVDQLLADQAANSNATDPSFKGKQRAFASSIGALVAQKMAASGGQPVSVSRAEIIDWSFKDKPEILVKAVERVIQEKAIAQEAKKQGIKITDAELKEQTIKAIASARTTYHLDGKTDAQVLQSLGFRPAYLRPFVLTQITLEKLVKKEMIARNNGKAISNDDLRGASHILVKVNPDPANPANTDKLWADAKTKIDGIAADIKSGKITFEEAAGRYSEDGSKFQKGSLGIFPRGQMVPEFEKVVFASEKNKVSDPVRTQFGWHLIRVDQLGSEITGPEREAIVQRQIQGRLGPKAQQIMAAAKVNNTVAAAPAPQQGMVLPGNR